MTHFLPAGCIGALTRRQSLRPRRPRCQNELRCHHLASRPLAAPVHHGSDFPLPARLRGAQAAAEPLRGGSGPRRQGQQDPTGHPMVGPRGDPPAAQQAEGRRLPHRLRHGVHGKTGVGHWVLTVISVNSVCPCQHHGAQARSWGLGMEVLLWCLELCCCCN